MYEAITNFFSLRLEIKPKQRDFYKNFLSLVLKSMSYCSKEDQFKNADEMLKVLNKITVLQEINGGKFESKEIK